MNIDCVQCNLQILIIWPSKLILHFIYCIVSFLIACIRRVIALLLQLFLRCECGLFGDWSMRKMLQRRNKNCFLCPGPWVNFWQVCSCWLVGAWFLTKLIVIRVLQFWFQRSFKSDNEETSIQILLISMPEAFSGCCGMCGRQYS